MTTKDIALDDALYPIDNNNQGHSFSEYRKAWSRMSGVSSVVPAVFEFGEPGLGGIVDRLPG
jgi:hypothetical protein